MPIDISQEALEEIAVIQRYLLASFGEKICNDIIDKIYKDIYLLEENPYFGRQVMHGVRKFNSGLSIIIYEIKNQRIEIHHVVDGRSDYANTLFT